jgi:hypothetical protein
VIQEINAPHSLHARIGHFVDAIKQELRCFSYCSWIHCYRESNCVAHVIAKKASSLCLSRTWIERCLYLFLMLFVESLLSLDCNLVIFFGIYLT